MSEQLLNTREVCKRLGIGRTTFCLYLSDYIADGLDEVQVKGSRGRLFTESSVNALIAESIKTGTAVGELRNVRRGRKAS